MEIGIIGLPNVGKSTLFNVLTSMSVACSNYPFCTIEPNVGVVEVPDERLNKLCEIYPGRKVTKATIKVVDIAGLIKGSSKGEGLGNKFLSHIRATDALLQVVRGFSSADVVNTQSEINPIKEIETITTELILADLETIEKIKEKLNSQIKVKNKEAMEKYEILSTAYQILNSGKRIKECDLINKLDEFSLLSVKPCLYVINVDEDGLKQDFSNIQSFIEENFFIVVSVKLEQEILQLPKEERESFYKEWGQNKSLLNKIIIESYKLLDLVTFFTVVGSKEIRAWTIKKGSTITKAAGKIHSDMERGFIKAEVYSFDDLDKGDEKKLRELGLVRIEGKDYIVQDGDIIKIKFNV